MNQRLQIADAKHILKELSILDKFWILRIINFLDRGVRVKQSILEQIELYHLANVSEGRHAESLELLEAI